MPAEQREQSDDAAREWKIHSFIIKIWQDLAAERENGWRGHITHIPGTERHYVKSLDQITDFIAPYLSEMGVRLRWSWRVRRWLWAAKSKAISNAEKPDK